MRSYLKKIIAVIPALAAYAVLAGHLDFLQDDAYISFRYVGNYLAGHGLVYNIGEHIEGITNFGWTIYLILWGALGADYIVLARISGFLLGGGTILLTYSLAGMVFKDRNRWFVLFPTYLVGINMSLAYWSPGGLETAAFAFFALLSLYFYLKRDWLLIASLALAVWIRPEGAVIAGILLIVESLIERRVPLFTLKCTAVALFISSPFVIFKILYYGGILPNPFYAKTGMDWSQLTNGLEYAGGFFSDYGFYGAGFVLTGIFFRKLSAAERSLFVFAVLYIVYIVLIGGDVLKVHRFFLPVFGPAAIIAALSLWFLLRKLTAKTLSLVLFVTFGGLATLTYYMPKAEVDHYNFYERMFMKKMRTMALDMKASDSTNFSVAVPTIGVFGYELLGHKIFDMVGLTDSTVARHSEPPIEGMETTWKEAKHNSRYLLESAPDYILFSTGKKPSAPAERALLLYPQFRDCYRAVGWFYRAFETQSRGVTNPAFKRMREITGEIVPDYPVEYVELYKTGLDRYVEGDARKAIEYFDKAIAASPGPPYVYVLYQKAFCHLLLKERLQAVLTLDGLLARDSLVVEAHRDLYLFAMLAADTAKADIHAAWVKKLTPWYWPRVEADVARRVELARRQL